MQKNSDNFSMEEAMRMARSDTGKELYALLQKQNSAALQQAMADANAGNMGAVKKTLESLMASEEVRKLIKKMGG